VSYSSKHNHANGEGNADGRDGELCANHGAEGSTLDPDILQRRDRVRRAMLATLLLAQGTPMLCAGDEIGKTQQGNNNAYCQDNALSWLNWEQADAALLTFVAQVVALRQREPSLRQADWFAPGSVKGAPARLSWRAPDGTALQGAQWHDLGNTAMACWMQVGSDDAGQAASLLLLLNPTERELDMQLPAGHWQRNLDSSSTLNMQSLDAAWIGVPSHSLLLLRQVSPLSPPTSGNTDEP
jgi:glycogen operon protein